MSTIILDFIVKDICFPTSLMAINGTLENRIAEYVDHLREYFINPVVLENAAYGTQ